MLVGADIEVFLQHKDTDEIVSAEGIIPGTKESPYKFKEGDDFFALSLDNVMAEFCIPPARTANEFDANIQEAIHYIEKSIPDNLKVLAIPSANIKEEFLQTENAKLFGCDPDYNAWTLGGMNPKPEANSTLRSCGGHIHVGYKNPNMNLSMGLIRAMDIFIGLPSILQEPDNQRKSLYGKAGAFRFKKYGAEYRTVSNYYINSPELRKWAFNNTQEAIEFVNNGLSVADDEAKGIQAAINFNDAELAKTLCAYFNVKLVA